MMTVSRRDFLGAGAAAAAGLALPSIAEAMPRHRRARPIRAGIAAPFAGRPVIISAANGLQPRPSGKRGIKVAWDMMSSGADPLDAVVAGVQIVELDPNDQSVGLGGPAERGRRGSARRELHARADEARGVGRVPRGRRRGGRRRASSHGVHRPHHARRRGRQAVRARDGIQGAESSHRGEPAGLAAVEVAAQSERHLARSAAEPRRRSVRRRQDDEHASNAAHRSTIATASRTRTARST